VHSKYSVVSSLLFYSNSVGSVLKSGGGHKGPKLLMGKGANLKLPLSTSAFSLCWIVSFFTVKCELLWYSVMFSLLCSFLWETCHVKPKFHYADFATKSGTSSRTCRRHKSWKSATQITSPTFMICVYDTCHGLCRKHLDMSRWFVFATFVICVHDFPRGEVSMKVGVMEFGLYQTYGITQCYLPPATGECAMS